MRFRFVSCRLLSDVIWFAGKLVGCSRFDLDISFEFAIVASMNTSSESFLLALTQISPAMLALAGGAIAALILLLVVLLVRSGQVRREQAEVASLRAAETDARMAELLTVSYTHLTLPTNREV